MLCRRQWLLLNNASDTLTRYKAQALLNSDDNTRMRGNESLIVVLSWETKSKAAL